MNGEIKCPHCNKSIEYLRTPKDRKIFLKAERWFEGMGVGGQLEILYDIYCLTHRRNGRVKE